MSDDNYTSLVGLLEEKAQKKTDFPLYTFLQGSTEEHKILTYGELAEQAKIIALVLQKTMKPGERVIIIYPPGLDLIAAFFGCLYAGVIVIPVYPPSTKDLVAKLNHIINNSEARVVLTTHDILQQIKKLRIAKWLSRNSLLNKAAQQIVGPSFNRSLQLIGWDFEKMRFIATDKLAQSSTDKWTPPHLNHESLAFLQYTSGSTGKPKGVMVSHGNLLNNLAVTQVRNQSSEEDVCVSWLPPYHDMGLIAGILQPLYSGYPVKLMSPLTFLQRPAVWLETMSHFKATISGAPNFAYDLCINKVTDVEKSQLDLSHWKIAATGAEPIRCTTIDRFSSVFEGCGFKSKAFYPCYGLAESTLMVTAVDRDSGVQSHLVDNKALSQGTVSYCDEANPDARRLVNCGKPAENFDILIVNPDMLTACSEGQVGEIWVYGKSVTRGYWQLPNESEHYFQARLPNDARTFLRTGDFGYLSEGSLYVTGRLKDIIIIRGRNYYPHDLEHTIHTCHPDLRVNCCAIFSIEEKEQELLVVVQEIKDDAAAGVAGDIIRAIRSSILKSHGITADIVVLAGRKSVPKTTSGKIQRVLCKKRYLEGSLNIIYSDSLQQKEVIALNDAEYHERAIKSTPCSQLLKPVFEQDIDTLDKEKKLSELGLNSLKLGELQYLLSTHTGTRIPLEYLLMDPCLKDILALLSGKESLQQLACDNQVDLAAEFEKYKEIQVDAVVSDLLEPQNILLTGATGFLGAYLLKELLDTTPWQVTCLVQASSNDAGITRVVKNMETYGLWQPEYHGRLHVVLGNLEKPKLGLSMTDWDTLATDMDLILHSAAALNFIYPYQKLMASNVLGTRHVLELAGHKRLKAVHYVSTIGYFWSADLSVKSKVCEESELNLHDGLYGGYNQTKWLAEKLVTHARSLNIPTIIYRPSLITGSSDTGNWNQADVICRVIKGCSLMGARPKLNETLNFVPVDYVAKSIVHFAKDAPYQSDRFHLINQEDVNFNQSFGYIDHLLNIKPVEYDAWLQMIREYCESNDGLFAPLRPFFLEKVINKDASLFELYMYNNKSNIDCAYTQERLAKVGIHCAKTDEELLTKYFNYLHHCGYFAR